MRKRLSGQTWEGDENLPKILGNKSLTRNWKILYLRRSMSFSLIAELLGTSRSAVAGVCFRADWPPGQRLGLGRRRGQAAPLNNLHNRERVAQ